MKRTYLLLLTFMMPCMVYAQTNQKVKNPPAAKEMQTADEQVFRFPDNISFRKVELNERVERKTQELTKCMKKLAEKKDPDYKEQVKIAMKLFNNDTRKMVTVTRKSQPEPITMPVKTYLGRLAQLHYDKVTVIWHNAAYVSNFIKQPDGTYSALVAYEQEFTGTKGGEIFYAYKDVTQKRIEVAVKVWDKKENGVVTKSYMDVFLGNIGVTEE